MSTSLTSGTYPRAGLPFFSLRRMTRTVLREVRAYGFARAARHLELAAREREHGDPELAQQLRTAAESCRPRA